MAALVQTLPSSTTTATMMHSRPGSADRYTSASSNHHHSSSRSSQKYGSMPATGYRGVQTTGPVAPYAFTATPQLPSPQIHHLSQPSSSVPSQAPQLPLLNLTGTGPSLAATMSSRPAAPSTPSPPISSANRTVEMPISTSNTTAPNPAQPARAAPDRYRRNLRRTDTGDSVSAPIKPQVSALPSGSGMAAVGQLYSHPTKSSSTPSLNSNPSYRGTAYGPTNISDIPLATTTSDDIQLSRQQQNEPASRYRRRSLGNLETPGLTHHANDSSDTASPHPNAFISPPAGDYMSVQHRPSSAHQHRGSSESVTSSRSGQSSRPSSARPPSSSQQLPHIGHLQANQLPRQDARNVNVAGRHGESSRRNASPLSNPSPLSRPLSPSAEDELSQSLAAPKAAAAPAPSPAAEHLAALNQKEAKKSKSKLRRAFSFGSAAELRKATAQSNLEKANMTDSGTANAATATNKRASRHEEDLDPESARVAAKQEAAGLGESIYSGQGNFFTGSTDNLSISSTASSASIMLRKMGKGVKKGTRSLVGLFRPKSVVGVPAADGPVNAASVAQVSMVTVEAEREKVNVNVDPHDHAGGGTGFPKLERNSMENKMSLDSGTNSTDTRSRRSIIGGERERAEILAAVKKGILKRTDSNQSSPSLRPTDGRPELTLPSAPHINDSPRSSAPSTPKDEQSPAGHRRTDSITINDHHDDYFNSVTRFASLDSKTGAPLTPSRNISFSPRIQFHDTWPSAEYDRRGEIATCNRLTPMLAQQIKEELNTFKMEMEVHESSKVYTHFF